jgi:hypothetical protein
MTQPELIALSGFRLPAVHYLDLPTWRDLRRGPVPATTRARARWLDKHGCFDIPKRWSLKKVDDWPLTVWSRPMVRQGEPRLYHALDLLVVQLDSWMRREGLRNSQIVELLRGRYALRYALLGRAAYQPDAQVVYSPSPNGGAIYSESAWAAFNEQLVEAGLPPIDGSFVFPLPWLGIFRGGLEKLERIRKDSVTVTSHRRAVTVDDLVKAQAPRVASVQMFPKGDGTGARS